MLSTTEFKQKIDEISAQLLELRWRRAKAETATEKYALDKAQEAYMAEYQKVLAEINALLGTKE